MRPSRSERRGRGAAPSRRWAAAVIGATACAADARDGVEPEFGVGATRTETPPRIDGVLDDEAWLAAPPLINFTQVDPDEGAPPTERTELRILFDKDNLYVAIRCWDSDAAGIRVTQMQYDGNFGFDDSVAIVLDPFDRLREGYRFDLTPGGAKRDALIENGDEQRRDWDGIWEGRATIDADGWSAEFAIPFKTIAFDPVAPRWGFNAQRIIRRNRETIRWASPQRARDFDSVADAGSLTGLEDLDKGVGLDVKPFLRGTYRRDDESGDSEFELEPGLDLFYRITPKLTLALTFNTDFAETEVDDRRVNLTRFPLFFPEKRDFFLQDAGIFEFGGIGRNPLPYFSRRIGIGPDGTPADIVYGAKLTGRVGDLNIGLLNTQVDSVDGVPSKNLTVGRLSVNVLRESTAGVIFTVGDPQTDGDNALAGADFNYRNSRDFGDDTLRAHAYFMRSETPDLGGDQNAFGGSVRYTSDVFQWSAFFTHVGADFNPALGFSPRRGIREYIANTRQRWRPEDVLRRVDFRFNTTVIEGTGSGEIETANVLLPGIEFETEEGEVFELGVRHRYELLDEGFEISDGIVIPVGDYRFRRAFAELNTSRSRPLSGSVSVEAGEFFSGSRTDFEASLDWRPSRFFALSATYEQSDVDLEEGSFITRVLRVRGDVTFSPDLSWNTTLQWDNVSDVMGINSRVRWIYRPGQEVFFVVNQGFSTEDDRLDALATEITLKVGLTLRF